MPASTKVAVLRPVAAPGQQQSQPHSGETAGEGQQGVGEQSASKEEDGYAGTHTGSGGYADDVRCSQRIAEQQLIHASCKGQTGSRQSPP